MLLNTNSSVNHEKVISTLPVVSERVREIDIRKAEVEFLAQALRQSSHLIGHNPLTGSFGRP